MKICHCNLCNNNFQDPNPGNDSIDYQEENLPSLIFCFDENDIDKKYAFWGCPICKTDGYLADNKII